MESLLNNIDLVKFLGLPFKFPEEMRTILARSVERNGCMCESCMYQFKLLEGGMSAGKQ